MGQNYRDCVTGVYHSIARMNSTNFFYRSNIHCLLAEDDNDSWMGFVGLMPNHPTHGSAYKRVIGIGLHKYTLTSEMLNTNNAIWLGLWWMGFQTNPYSKEKTIDLLKKIADEIGEVSEVEIFLDEGFTFL